MNNSPNLIFKIKIMKKTYLLFLIVFATVVVASSQVPAGFNYQAVVRNSSGEVIANKTVSFRISILEGAGKFKKIVYAEKHSVKTNAFGMANFMVGKGAKISGAFSPSGWGKLSHYLKIEIDVKGGNSFSFLSTTQLMAVPYAFHAQTVESVDILKTGADAGINVKTTSGNAYMLIDRPNNGQAADVAFKTNGVLKFMAGFLPGSDNYRISSKYSSLKGLEVEPDGDVNITKELHSVATGQANMVPVAFGYVQPNGSIYKVKSTPNFTGVNKPATGKYDLTITGIKYNGTSYNVLVTNTTTQPRVFSVGYNPATYNIFVFAYDLNGNKVDAAFSFIVYKGNGN